MGRRTFRIRRPYNSDSPSLSREHLLKNYRKLSETSSVKAGLGRRLGGSGTTGALSRAFTASDANDGRTARFAKSADVSARSTC